MIEFEPDFELYAELEEELGPDVEIIFVEDLPPACPEEPEAA